MTDYFDLFERELRDAARRSAHLPWYLRLRAGRSRALVVALACLVTAGAGTAALAATGVIPFGSPVPAPHYRLGAFAQVQGVGVVEASTARLEATAPDPAGGLPWAMRIVKTTHHIGCLQAGRYEDGQIGVIGENGVFHNDGRFHPLPLNALATACLPTGASGQLIANAEAGLVPTDGNAIGWPFAGECSPPQTYGKHIQFCPITDERYLFYGLLGPQAQRVTYRSGSGATRSLRPSGPDGAYLIVERAGSGGDMPGSDGFNSGGGIGLLPNLPILSVTYRNGLRCDYVTNGRPTRACATPPGYTPPAIPSYTRAQLASSVQAVAQHTKGGWSYSVSFIARAPVTNTLSDYIARLTLVRNRCYTGDSYVGSARPGQRITIHVRQLPGVAGRYHGAVYFASNAQGRPLVLGFPGSRTVLVGTFTLVVPRHYYRPGSISGCS